eukprot:4842317-Pyramimonas_sp.AAC.1
MSVPNPTCKTHQTSRNVRETAAPRGSSPSAGVSKRVKLGASHARVTAAYSAACLEIPKFGSTKRATKS